VTPTGIPSRREKLEMDFRALVVTALWPVINPSSSTTLSRSLAFLMASPSPTFTTTFTGRGTWWMFLKPNCSVRRAMPRSR
jgi:hypothetical protein